MPDVGSSRSLGKKRKRGDHTVGGSLEDIVGASSPAVAASWAQGVMSALSFRQDLLGWAARACSERGLPRRVLVAGADPVPERKGPWEAVGVDSQTQETWHPWASLTHPECYEEVDKAPKGLLCGPPGTGQAYRTANQTVNQTSAT